MQRGTRSGGIHRHAGASCNYRNAARKLGRTVSGHGELPEDAITFMKLNLYIFSQNRHLHPYRIEAEMFYEFIDLRLFQKVLKGLLAENIETERTPFQYRTRQKNAQPVILREKIF